MRKTGIAPDNRKLGWCTYNKTILESPEVEIMAEGKNEKTPKQRRSGQESLEFGFEIAPDKMNETGRAMPFNSIVYIAKFTQTAPLHMSRSAVNRLPAGRSCPAGPPTKECPSRCWRIHGG